MQQRSDKKKKRIHKLAGILLLVIGTLFLVYIGIWSTGALLWSFDIGVGFILISGLVMTASGVMLLFKRTVRWLDRHRLIARLALSAVLLFILSLVTMEGFVIHEANHNDSNVKADVVLIPGAAIVGDRPSRALQHRLDKALPYIWDNPNAVIIVSGAKGFDETLSEAEVMKQYLVDNGINGSRIIPEEKATNSIGNVGYSKEIIDGLKFDHKPKVMIITNDFHIFRMKLLARVQGMDTYGISVAIHYSVAPICYAKEYFSLMKLFITGMKAE